GFEQQLLSRGGARGGTQGTSRSGSQPQPCSVQLVLQRCCAPGGRAGSDVTLCWYAGLAQVEPASGHATPRGGRRNRARNFPSRFPSQPGSPMVQVSHRSGGGGPPALVRPFSTGGGLRHLFVAHMADAREVQSPQPFVSGRVEAHASTLVGQCGLSFRAELLQRTPTALQHCAGICRVPCASLPILPLVPRLLLRGKLLGARADALFSGPLRPASCLLPGCGQHPPSGPGVDGAWRLRLRRIFASFKRAPGPLVRPVPLEAGNPTV
ncbi:unnamed protein product, partial [Symbiodinium necroappetens]